jgi:hypothetical protein
VLCHQHKRLHWGIPATYHEDAAPTSLKNPGLYAEALQRPNKGLHTPATTDQAEGLQRQSGFCCGLCCVPVKSAPPPARSALVTVSIGHRLRDCTLRGIMHMPLLLFMGALLGATHMSLHGELSWCATSSLGASSHRIAPEQLLQGSRAAAVSNCWMRLQCCGGWGQRWCGSSFKPSNAAP